MDSGYEEEYEEENQAFRSHEVPDKIHLDPTHTNSKSITPASATYPRTARLALYVPPHRGIHSLNILQVMTYCYFL